MVGMRRFWARCLALDQTAGWGRTEVQLCRSIGTENTLLQSCRTENTGLQSIGLETCSFTVLQSQKKRQKNHGLKIPYNQKLHVLKTSLQAGFVALDGFFGQIFGQDFWHQTRTGTGRTDRTGRTDGNTVLQYYWDGEIQCTVLKGFNIFRVETFFNY